MLAACVPIVVHNTDKEKKKENEKIREGNL